MTSYDSVRCQLPLTLAVVMSALTAVARPAYSDEASSAPTIPDKPAATEGLSDEHIDLERRPDGARTTELRRPTANANIKGGYVAAVLGAGLLTGAGIGWYKLHTHFETCNADAGGLMDCGLEGVFILAADIGATVLGLGAATVGFLLLRSGYEQYEDDLEEYNKRKSPPSKSHLNRTPDGFLLTVKTTF